MKPPDNCTNEQHSPQGLVARWRLLLAATRDDRLSQGALAVLGVILDRMGNTGTAWPSITRIAIDSGVDRRTVTRALRMLNSLGYLDCERGTTTRTNTYRIGSVIGASMPLAVGARMPPSIRADSPLDQGRGCPQARGTDAPQISFLNQYQESSKEESAKNKEARGRAPCVVDLPSWIPKRQWDDYLDSRREARKSTGKAAQLKLIDKLQQLRADGEDLAAVLDQSTRCGYFDVHPVNEATTSSPRWKRQDPGPPMMKELGVVNHDKPTDL
ncbi:MAG: helix-turn-helix domain-containing protein [Xanthomonadales bacterium]|nr:helix-turn-helix domain-containing protein [Xanthomonadales bacterium]